MSGTWANPNSPNLADFTSWVYESMQVPEAALPTDSQWLGFAFARARALVIYAPTVTPIEYVLAVYNCGGHILLKITPDVQGQTFFADARKTLNLLSPITGVVQSSSDETTSSSLAVPDSLKNLSIGDLGFLQTPYGREYLAYAQDYGTGVWGLS